MAKQIVPFATMWCKKHFYGFIKLNKNIEDKMTLQFENIRVNKNRIIADTEIGTAILAKGDVDRYVQMFKEIYKNPISIDRIHIMEKEDIPTLIEIVMLK